MNPVVDLNQFIITRKRKKYKFAKFSNAENCFEFDQWLKCQGSTLTQITVEVGAGTGLFSVELAARHPDKIFVAVDVKADRLQKGAYEAVARQLDNIYFVRARADQLTEMFAAESVTDIWLTFADPFPKKRSAARRMTHQNFLKIYQQLLAKNAQLHIKHDNLAFFCWSLEQLVAANWRVRQLSFDLHDSDQNDDAKIETTYEKRWRQEGATINYAMAMKLDSAK
ncbi:tRNA (guanosine(46)-N7)-methyltransferase TrmB [Candidatus Saccharibacteria bacterium]|nr:tRNA (guanosine(46)-N7)-methyltransferase TrmB [Candidatus Saccharibacteria bacterium]